MPRWTDLVLARCSVAEFGAPATDPAIRAAEAALSVAFNDELRSLLRESDGVAGEYGLGLIWPVDRIVSDNLIFRDEAKFGDLYAPFDQLLFFADVGNGDQFALRIDNGVIADGAVYCWNHEDDGRPRIASSIREYLEGWLNGTIKV